MVAILAFFATLAAVDKNFLTLVVPDIKADFGITDVQVGLLIGLAFAVSNVAVSLPAGWAADRANRRLIIAGGVMIWSSMTVMCGFARQFGLLFVARVGVGFGEGISPPASYSLIRDGVSPERRGLAYAIFSIGGAVGSGFAFLVGGFLIAWIASLDLSGMPYLAALPHWQVALVLIGAAGLPLALLAFAFTDPGRAADDRIVQASVAQTWAIARQRWRILLPLMIFSVVQTMLTMGLSAWVPALLQRTFHVEARSFGPMLGMVLIIGAPLGLVGAGLLMDRLGKNGPAIAAVIASAVVAISGAIGPHVPAIELYWPCQAAIIMVSTVYLPVTSTVVARVMPAATIGTTMAAFLLAQGMMGAGLGPLVIALFTEHLFSGSGRAINSAITSVSLLLGGVALAAAILMLLGSRRPDGEPL
nr:MFS transporter [Sphingomonas sp. Y57]